MAEGLEINSEAEEAHRRGLVHESLEVISAYKCRVCNTVFPHYDLSQANEHADRPSDRLSEGLVFLTGNQAHQFYHVIIGTQHHDNMHNATHDLAVLFTLEDGRTIITFSEDSAAKIRDTYTTGLAPILGEMEFEEFQRTYEGELKKLREGYYPQRRLEGKLLRTIPEVEALVAEAATD
ncbi:MAG: hypothetical protein KKF56_04530 [Nanoarchaeota archaeon]|nr:hypothetical protein [Nanoarchaeota archaeon]